MTAIFNWEKRFDDRFDELWEGSCTCCTGFERVTDDVKGFIREIADEAGEAIDAAFFAEEDMCTFQDDIAELLVAAGLSDHARPISCHAIVQDILLPAVKKLQENAVEPEDVLPCTCGHSIESHRSIPTRPYPRFGACTAVIHAHLSGLTETCDCENFSIITGTPERRDHG